MTRKSHRLGRLLLVLAAAMAHVAGARDDPLALEPGRPVERRLAPGEAHGFEVASTGGEAWRLRARQLGVDLAIEVRDPAGQSLGVVDGPVDRRGVETVLVEPEAGGRYRVEVRASSPRAAAGGYQLLLEPVAVGAPAARRAAERAMTAAGRHATGDRESRRAALGHYREALGHWQTLGERRGEARTLHAMALLRKGLRAGERGDVAELFRRAAELWQELGEPGLEALALAELALAGLDRDNGEEARRLLERALALNRQAGQLFEAAGNRMDLGYVAQRQGALRQALASYEEALRLYREVGDRTYQALLLNNLGGVFWQLGEAEAARDRYQESLALHRAAGERREEAGTLNNLAALHRSLGEAETALALYADSGRIYAEIGDRRGEGRVLNNTGYAYRELGELERARGYFLRAVELRHEIGDRRGAAVSLSNLGSLHDRRGEVRQALDYHHRSLLLKQALGDRRGESISASLVGRALARLGEGDAAREHFVRARGLLAGLDDPPAEARALLRQAEGLQALGEAEQAATASSSSLALLRRLDEPVARAEALAVLARAERDRARLAEAGAAIEEALATVEGLRAELGNPALRDAFLSSRASLWELRVDLWMERHRLRPEAGFEGAALEAAERSRARGLLDLLAEAGAELSQGFDPRLVDRRRQLVRRLGVLVERRSRARAANAEQAAAIEEVRAELDLVEAELRRRQPRFAALTRPRPLAAGAMQGLLDAQTLLLYYALGEERSFLWAVTAASIDAFVLPPRRQLEAAARNAHRELSRLRPLAPRAGRPSVAALAGMVLGPVADRLGDGARLAVVADGALHWVPFAALPLPPGSRRAGELVLERHQVRHLPSVSVLAALAGPSPRAPGPRSVAVVADPVFDVCDPRVPVAPGGVPPPCLSEPTAGDEPMRHERLPGSRREAEAIAALAAGEALLALDFDARLELVTGGRLGRYRFVHFATHGVVDSRDPRLSGLVLAGSDAGGRRLEGMLRLDEIYDLELAADLVVLSGCRTALGQELRGEGLVGLVRGFLYAGARQVVASLWRVDDRATAELMRHFYGALLDRGLDPAAALRSAQLEIARRRSWNEPYYWAAFVLQGGEGPKSTPGLAAR